MAEAVARIAAAPDEFAASTPESASCGVSVAFARRAEARSVVASILEMVDRDEDGPELGAADRDEILRLRASLEAIWDGIVSSGLVTLDELLGSVDDIAAVEGVFAAAALPWHLAGFAVIPGGGGEAGKAPRARFKHLSGPHRRRQLPAELLKFARRHPDAPALLLLDSGPVDLSLVGIDVDDLALVPWVVESFGETPLQVTTGREGGGVHLYYRAPLGVEVRGRNGLIGPKGSIAWDTETDPRTGEQLRSRRWGRSRVDVKSRRGYLLAAGSLHRSGVRYESSVSVESLTPEWLRQNLPVFDNELYEQICEEAKRRRSRRGFSTTSGSRRALLIREADGAVRAQRLDRQAGEVPPGGEESLELWPTDLRSVSRERGLANLAALRACPFICWCAENPGALGHDAWRGLASNLFAACGEDGRAVFHELSMLDLERYNPRETDSVYSHAAQSVIRFGPLTYERLTEAGWPGPVPPAPKAPAGRVGILATDVASPGEEALAIDAARVTITPVSGSGEYLPELSRWMDKKVLALQADLGSGKTERAVEQSRGFPRVTVITPTRALASAAAFRFDAHDYQRSRGVLEQERVAVCLNSIPRRPPGCHEDGLLVLDEMEQLADALYGDTVGKASREVFGALHALVSVSAKVIVADAFLSRRSLNLLGRLGVDPDDVVVLQHRVPSGVQEVLRLANDVDAYRVLRDSVARGERVYVACTALADLKAMEEMIRESSFGATGKPPRVLALHSQMGAAARETLQEPTKHWSAYDVVLGTSAVGSGVSFDEPGHFDCVVVLARSLRQRMPAWTDLLQAAKRVRRTRSGRLYAYVAPRKCRAPTDMDVIASTERSKAEGTAQEVGGFLLQARLQDPHFGGWCETLQAQRIRSARAEDEFFAWLTRADVPVNDHVPPVAGEEPSVDHARIAELKRRVQERKAKEVVAAEDLTESEASRIARSGPRDLDETRAMERRRLLDTFGTISVPLAVEDRSGAVSTQVQGLVSAGLGASGIREPLCAEDRMALEQGSLNSLAHELTTTRLVCELLLAAGLDPLVLTAELQIGLVSSSDGLQEPPDGVAHTSESGTSLQACDSRSHLKMAEIAELTWSKDSLMDSGFIGRARTILDRPGARDLLQGRNINPRLGAWHDGEWREDPCRTLGAILKSIGIRTSSQMTRVGGGRRIRVYRVDMDSLGRILGLARRQNRVRRGFRVPSVEEIGRLCRAVSVRELETDSGRRQGDGNSAHQVRGGAMWAPRAAMLARQTGSPGFEAVPSG